jgi:hypothetical protein
MNSMPFRQLKSFLKILIGVQYENTDTYETSGCHTTAGCQRVKNLAEESSPQAARACAQQTVRPFISKGLWPSEISEKARRSVLFLVTRRGFEPRTHCLKGSCSAN